MTFAATRTFTRASSRMFFVDNNNTIIVPMSDKDTPEDQQEN